MEDEAPAFNATPVPPALAAPPPPQPLPLRQPRSSRGVPKRAFEELEYDRAVMLQQAPRGKRSKRGAPQSTGAARAPRSPDEKRKLSRQMTAYMRLGLLVLPEHVKARAPAGPAAGRGHASQIRPAGPPALSWPANALVRAPMPRHALTRTPQLTKKQSKDDEEGLEYRATFNVMLDCCFGESLRAWAHVNNWFFLHAGE